MRVVRNGCGTLRLGQNEGSQSGLSNKAASRDVLPDCIALPAPLRRAILIDNGKRDQPMRRGL
jgi:hypothetical protein